MTDNQFTPTHAQVYQWWESAIKGPPSTYYEKLDYLAKQAAQWGADLAAVKAARRSKPKSRKQRALDALTQIEDQCLSAELAAEIRNALEELPDD